MYGTLAIMENLKLAISVLFVLLQYVGFGGAFGRGKGQWQLLLNNTGVVAMHMALTHHNTVIMYDQRGSAPSGYQLSRRFNGTQCSQNRNDLEDQSCYAYSVEYDVSGNSLRPLRLDTDLWCSSGAFLGNGTLLQTGGHGTVDVGSGTSSLVMMTSVIGGNQSHHYQLNGGTLPIRYSQQVTGSLSLVERVFSYEFVPKLSSGSKSTNLPFLRQTYGRQGGGLNLYPFLHLSSDGNLFIFANRDSILLNYRQNKVVKHHPQMPGNGSRNYPSTGSSVVLPLDHKNGFNKVEVMVCGGAAPGAYSAARRGRYLNGLKSCGRMVITGNRNEWEMEEMPDSRLLNDMLILPTGDILIINGAKRGCAGYDNARNPSLQPYLYKPTKTPGSRFSIFASAKIARMYHSSAILLPDGKVLVAGGNPHSRYTFGDVKYPTELRLQAFLPDHMSQQFNHRRPRNVTIHYRGGGEGVGYGKEFGIEFQLRRRPDELVFSVYAPPFTSHSISMNQRMLMLKCRYIVRNESGWANAVVEAPPAANVAPASYYLLTVVNGGIPSLSQWVRFIHG